MIIKALLIGIVLLITLWFLTNRTSAHARAGVKLIIICFTAIATLVILFPEFSNDVANAVGVGRGADLILYLLVTFFIFFILNYYLRSNDEQKRIVKLARKLAIVEANESEHNQKVLRKVSKIDS